jgi:type VI secretion system protein ImpH
MGSETRPSNPGLMKALQDKPHAFSFFQVVQLLQRYLGGVRLGDPGPASEEQIRLRPAVSLSFPAADVLAVEAINPTEAGKSRYRITTSFMGLYSSDSPLPTFYTEDLFWKENDQKAVQDFLDIFQHRALSLLYRAWEKYRYNIQFRHGGEDEFSRRVFSLLGMGTAALVDITGLPSVRLLRYTGVITRKPHSASALAGMLRDYFELPGIEVGQCVERQVRIDPSQQNRLGAKSCTLGRDLSLGATVRDVSGKFRVTAGPLSLGDYLRFLPVSKDFAAMVNLIRLYVTDRLDFDIEVKLRSEEAPPLQLSSQSPQRLGWTSFLPHPRRDPSVVHRQPVIQSPQDTYAWPGSAISSQARQQNRGQNDRS